MIDQLKDDNPLCWTPPERGVVFSPTLYSAGGTEDEEPPRIRLAELRKKVSKIVDAILRYKGEILGGEVLSSMAETICRHIKYPVKHVKTVFICLEEFQGVQLTDKMLWRIGFKINGNKESILKDVAIPTWNPHSDTRIWVPVHVVNVEYAKTKKARTMIRLGALIMDGPPAGIILVQRIPVKYARWFLKELGLPKFDQVNEFEVFNSMFSAYIGRDADNKIVMMKFHANSPQKEHNRELHKKRNECPKHHQPWFCDRCPMGTDSCEYAVKKYSWKVMACKNGHDGYFRKRSDGTYGEYCVRCLFIHKQKRN